jgi:hypothetical protein
MTTASPTEIRIAVPLSPHHRDLIEQAAAQSGQSLDDFALSALLESARRVNDAAGKSVVPEGNASGESNGADQNRKRRFERGELLPGAEHVILDDLALIGWSHLPGYAQEYICRTLDALALRSASDWPRRVVEPWRADEQLYALHTLVGPDHLLVLFRREGDFIRLRQLVLKETIERYFTPKNGG